MARFLGVAAAGILGALIGQSAAAVERGFYVGGYYGQNDHDASEAAFENQTLLIYDAFGFIPQQSSTSFDNKDSGFGFVGGYRLLRNLAFEASYIDLGEVTYRDASDGVFDDGAGTITPESWEQSSSRSVSGIALSALGIWPISYRFEVFLRGGVVFSNTDVSVYLTDGIGELRDEISSSNTDFLAGIGAAYYFAEIYALRLEYQRIFDAGDDEGYAPEGLGESDVDTLSLGFTVHF